MRDPILPGGIDVPPVRPPAHRQHNLLPHEASQHMRVEGHVHKEQGRDKEESSIDEWYLRGVLLASLISRASIDPYDFASTSLLEKLAHTQFTLVKPGG